MNLIIRILAHSVAAFCLFAPAAAAQSAITTRYVQALEMHQGGQSEQALALLDQLASEVPASIPVHSAMAWVALDLGEDEAKALKTRFWRRLRRTSRDVGASVGRSIILHQEGRTREAHNLLLSALTSGARHPLLVPLLVETTADPVGLATWMENRARVLPRDGAFAALRVQYLLAIGQGLQAGQLIDKSMERYSQQLDVLALSARWHRARGYEREAARLASLAAGALSRQDDIPEIRVPRRLNLARDLIAGGQIDQARAMLGALGPMVTLSDGAALGSGYLVVQAELALALEEPFRSLALLDEASPVAPPWREAAQAVRSRARAALGLAPDLRGILGAAPPSGFDLADRSTALAGLVRHPAGGSADLLQAINQLIPRLRQAGLDHRASRLEVLGAFLTGDAPDSRAQMTQPSEIGGEATPRGAPLLSAARRLVVAGWAMQRGDSQATLDAANLPIEARTQSPGSLLAALHLLSARAALSMGEPAEAERAVREGMLDLQEADMSPLATPPELLPVETAFGDPGAALPGIAFAAALASGQEVSQAGGALLRNLGRATRSWSTLGASWPGNLAELTRLLDKQSCLLLVTPEPLAPALAIAPGHAPVAMAPEEIFSAEACRRARVVYWLGPAAPPGGLRADPSRRQVLVRLVAPHRVWEQAVTSPEVVEIRQIGPGQLRPLRQVVETTLEKDETAPQGVSRAVASLDDAWPVFHGAGIASSRSPLASGWLVPHSMSARGWIGPEDVADCGPVNGTGLVALGLKTILDGKTAEKGSWLLAEAALSSGKPWALLSRQPLSDDARARVVDQLPDWRSAPLDGALRLIEKDPALADQLTLWTTPGLLASPKPSTNLITLGALALALAAVVGFWIWRRKRR